MKLFNATQQSANVQPYVHLTVEELMSVIDTSSHELKVFSGTLSTVRESVRMMRKIDRVKKTNRGVYNVTMESINDQLGYPEGTRLTTEGVVDSVKEFGRRVWAKIKAAWRAIKGAYVRMLYRYGNWMKGTTPSQIAVFIKDYDKIVSKSNLSPYRKISMNREITELLEDNEEGEFYSSDILDKLFSGSATAIVDTISVKGECTVDTGTVKLSFKDGNMETAPSTFIRRPIPLIKAIEGLGHYQSTIDRVGSFIDDVEAAINAKTETDETFTTLVEFMGKLTEGNKALILMLKPLMDTFGSLVRYKRIIKGDNVRKLDEIHDISQKII